MVEIPLRPLSPEKRLAPRLVLGVFCCEWLTQQLSWQLSYECISQKGGYRLMSKSQEGSEKREVYCRYIVKNGKTIYPKSGTCFHFFI